MAFPAIIAALAPVLGRVANNLFPDPQEAARAEQEMLSALMAREAELQGAVSNIIQAEARSEHWLTSTWRPITMLTFLSMLVGYWFDVLPDAAYQRITPDMFDQFVGLLKIGVGGYIVSRGAEKVAERWRGD